MRTIRDIAFRGDVRRGHGDRARAGCDRCQDEDSYDEEIVTGLTPACWSTRFNPNTTRKIATAGLSSHGKSTSVRVLDASCSIAPQLATGSGKPSPMYDIVASAMMKAGTSIVNCTTM